MDFNPFVNNPQFNPSKHLKSTKRKVQPWEQLQEGKCYEIKIEGEETRTYEVRGFWCDESDGTIFVILWPEGETRATDFVSNEILSVREINKNADM
ncbi:hypothetical protein LG291_25250 (plasmid) [Cytobacillus firmus]|uniref:Uncharacterized protein n=1 Tax=Cytobacillus firmus DS1 TaxID=1307436 RepID=W7KS65_CYTFI|nr:MULTISPECIES: hypothetical protein [Bacillaceae]EWG08993.1 hypothetical protein PBF_21493 [Cytobacillus firmus DS1]MBN8202533.1 hypothetical protein [Bacillus sp. NTK034]